MLAKAMKQEKKTKQVNVSLDGEVRRVFEWLKKYDPQFAGNDARTALHLMALGVEALKTKQAEVYEPLDADVVGALSASGMSAMQKVAE